MALIILRHYGSRTAEKEGFTGLIGNLWNICENLVTCTWIFARHVNPGLTEVAYGREDKLLGEACYRVGLIAGNVLGTQVAKILAGVGLVSVLFQLASFIHRVGGKSSELLLFCYDLTCSVLIQVSRLYAVPTSGWITL